MSESESGATSIRKWGLGGLFIALVAVAIVLIVLVNRDAPSDPAPAAQTERSRAPEPRDEPAIHVMRVDALPGVDDPFDARWDDAPVTDVPVQAQMMTQPMLDEATIAAVSVQAMRDGRGMAWRLAWRVAAPAQAVDTGRFPDAVALQLPLADGAPPIMGSQERPVHILYWNALWQRDVDEGFVDVQDLYPNFWNDLYWFAEGRFPYPVAESFEDGTARQWLAAHAADNPMAQLHREQPVQELFAEGFGTLTAYPDAHAAARGAWRDGQWTVVIHRPMDTDDALGHRLAAGEARAVALAVWDGAAGNVGGRKHWTIWVPMEMP